MKRNFFNPFCFIEFLLWKKFCGKKMWKPFRQNGMCHLRIHRYSLTTHPFTSATCACPIWVGHWTNTSVHPHSVYSPEGHTELTEEVHKCKIPIVTSVRRGGIRLGANMTDLRWGQEWQKEEPDLSRRQVERIPGSRVTGQRPCGRRGAELTKEIKG